MACEVVTSNAPLNLSVIGPRSVIVPADPIEWNAATSYEYLTLVSSADFGQGYVAKRDVPSGTPLTNTDYWIPVASFNAQVASLQKQYSNLSDNYTSLSSDLTHETSSRESADDTLQDNIDALSARVSSHNVIVCGDSFTAGTVGGVSSWVDMLPFKARNYAVNGAGFTVAGSGGATFLQQLNKAIEEISDKSAITEIIAYGSYNDRNTGSAAVSSAILSFVSSARKNFPAARIIVCYGNIGVPGSTDNDYINFINTLKISLMTGGTRCELHCAMPWLIPWNTTGYQSDNLHPNDTGQTAILHHMLNLILGSSTSSEMFIQPLTTVSGFKFTRKTGTITSELTWFAYYRGNTVYVWLRLTDSVLSDLNPDDDKLYSFTSSALNKRIAGCIVGDMVTAVPFNTVRSSMSGFFNTKNNTLSLTWNPGLQATKTLAGETVIEFDVPTCSITD